jgi:hypothetical protein
MDVQPFKITGSIGSTLGSDAIGSDILRLMIAMNKLDLLFDAFVGCFSKSGPNERATIPEGVIIYQLFIIGVLKEGIDAFWCLGGLPDRLFTQQDVPDKSRQDLARFKQVADKKNPESTYCRLLDPIRAEAAFHWKRSELQASLQTLSESTPLMTRRQRPGDRLRCRYPVADEALTKVMLGSKGSPADAVASIREVLFLFRDTIEVVVVLFLRERGAKQEAMD